MLNRDTMMDLYTSTSFECSKIVTERYSTSFSQGIRAFDSKLRPPVYAIYGFVRYADEIVDTFHDYNKRKLINQFKSEIFEALETGISLNPILHAFQKVVHKYKIETCLINAFFASMEMDLEKKSYSSDLYNTYVYGSAEVIGLMCLRVFCAGDDSLYSRLLPEARRLGSAFQKINFLRDIKADFEERGRVYFPGVDFARFSESDKKEIETDIQKDFEEGLKGIRELPRAAKRGVFVAYLYYYELFRKIRSRPVDLLGKERVRVSDRRKLYLMARALLQDKLNTI